MSAYEITGARHELTLMSYDEIAEVVGIYRQLGMPWRRIAALFHSTVSTVQNAERIAQKFREQRAAEERSEFEKDAMQVMLHPHFLEYAMQVSSL